MPVLDPCVARIFIRAIARVLQIQPLRHHRLACRTHKVRVETPLELQPLHRIALQQQLVLWAGVRCQAQAKQISGLVNNRFRTYQNPHAVFKKRNLLRQDPTDCATHI